MQAWALAFFADVERGIAAVHSAEEIAQEEITADRMNPTCSRS